MIYRKSYWALVRECRPGGRHPLVKFTLGMLALSALAWIGLAGSAGGYLFAETIIKEEHTQEYKDLPQLRLHYQLVFGWRQVCAVVYADYIGAAGAVVPLREAVCTALDAGAALRGTAVPLTPTSALLARAGLAIAASHLMVVVCALGFGAFCALLALDVMITPTGFPHMQFLGLSCTVTGLCLLCTLAAAYLFGVREALFNTYASPVWSVAPQWSLWASLALVAGLLAMGAAAFRASAAVDGAIAMSRFASTQGDDAVKQQVSKLQMRRLQPPATPPMKRASGSSAAADEMEALLASSSGSSGSSSSSSSAPLDTPTQLAGGSTTRGARGGDGACR